MSESGLGETRADLAAIFAGGVARRLGGADKGLLEVGGVSLWRRVSERLQRQTNGLIVAARAEPTWLGELEGAAFAKDAAGEGPAAALLAGLEMATARGSGWLLTAPVDAPFLPLDLFERLKAEQARTGARAAIVHAAGGLHPVFGLWRTDCVADVRAGLESGERALHRLAARVGAAACGGWEGRSPDPFFNINTPEDLAQADELAAGV